MPLVLLKCGREDPDVLKLAALAFTMAGLALPVAAQEPQIIDGDTCL